MLNNLIDNYILFAVLTALCSSLILFYFFRSDLNLKNLKEYSDNKVYLERLRFVALASFIFTPVFHYLSTDAYHFTDSSWLLVISVSTFALLTFLASFYKNIDIKVTKALTTVLSLVMALFTLYLVYSQNYNIIFTVELMAILAFAALIFRDLKHFLYFWIPTIMLNGIISYKADLSTMEGFTFIIGTNLIHFFSISYHLFQINNIGKMIFSDKILKSYDKLIVVYDTSGNVVYTNPYTHDFFTLEASDFIGLKWFDIRGFSIEKRNEIVLSIESQINSKKPIESYRELIYSEKEETNQLIKWSFNLVGSEYLLAIGQDITEAEENRLKIKDLSTISENVSNGIIVTDPEGIVLWTNQSFLDIFECELKDLLGKKTIDTIRSPNFKNRETNINIDLNSNRFNTAKKQQYYTFKDNLVWIHTTATPVYDENANLTKVIEVISDVTEEKTKEDEFKRMSQVAEHSQNPIIITDDKIQIEWINGAFVKEFMFSEGDILGKVPAVFMTSKNSDTSEIKRIQNHILKGKKISTDIVLANKLGDEKWYNISVDPIFDEKGKLVQSICVMQDIEKIKQIQKDVAIKNKEITDSIEYALRIQTAILPNLKLLKKLLPEYFLYYRPKDIVSGDFYFMEFKNNKVFFAVADCTGHGVPGAMMTSLGAAGLKNAILDKQLEDPARILDHLDFYIKDALSASTDEITDGMDICMLAFDIENNTIEYCGAKRPLIILTDNEPRIIPGIKKAIGEFSFGNDINFETTTIEVTEEMHIYAFSDGIPDQFGGIKGKKLYQKKFLDFLVETKAVSKSDQKKLLTSKMLNWTLNFEKYQQTDDYVCLGAKLSPDYFAKMKKIIKYEN